MDYATFSLRREPVRSKTKAVGHVVGGAEDNEGMEEMAAREEAVWVRPMTLGDAAAVAELVGQLSYLRTVDEVAKWIAGVQPETQAAFVACVGNEVVGWIEVSMERRLQYAPYALIGGLVVREGMRSLGIGRRLCEEAESWGAQKGASTIRVTSRSTREAAHRFYLRDGYELVKMSMVFTKQVGE
jgi:GNAT superfamily N-acetyltransferase